MAEAYGWGKVAGMVFPWIVDAGSRVAGVDVYSPEAFYIPWLYAMSDQMGANVAGLLHLWRKQGAATRAVARYLRHPVMLTSLRSEEHTSELQSLMRISYAVFCMTNK